MKSRAYNINKAKSQLDKEVLSVQNELQNHSKFELEVIVDESDGILILNRENLSLAEYERCLNEINRAGVLTSEFHYENRL